MGYAVTKPNDNRGVRYYRRLYRDLNWAYRHLGDLSAAPPSERAGRLCRLAGRDLGAFMALYRIALRGRHGADVTGLVIELELDVVRGQLKLSRSPAPRGSRTVAELPG